MTSKNSFSKTTTVFRNYTLPESDMSLAGYSALIDHFDLNVPLPYHLSAISKKHSRYKEGRWMVYTIRHKPENHWFAHLTFSLKYEGVDLLNIKKLFEAVKKSEVEKHVTSQPTGKYSRIIWFFYEWLMGENLDLPDATTGNYVDALDSTIQYAGSITLSKRHRVRNNLPGVPGFCPLIRKTETLEAIRDEELDKFVEEKIGKIHPDLLARAAAFLLLKDSKASYTIEGEQPPHNRVERWGRAIGQAGQKKLTMNEFLRLQEIVIQDRRFVKMGWRDDGGFIGVHDRISNHPVPDHISAKPEDNSYLMEKFLETYQNVITSEYDPVLAASLLAFGFVFIHPFQDGNGRIHRYLIHHILAEKNFAPKGLIFPVSAVILNRIDEYIKVLESFSRPRLDLIDWKSTPDGNVEVLNDTRDLYSYFDATPQAEFLYRCVKETALHTLPDEVRYLENHEEMRNFIHGNFDMPDKEMENLIGFLRQNDGKLSNRAKTKEFEALTVEEVIMLEETFKEIFLKESDH